MSTSEGPSPALKAQVRILLLDDDPLIASSRLGLSDQEPEHSRFGR